MGNRNNDKKSRRTNEHSSKKQEKKIDFFDDVEFENEYQDLSNTALKKERRFLYEQLNIYQQRANSEKEIENINKRIEFINNELEERKPNKEESENSENNDKNLKNSKIVELKAELKRVADRIKDQSISAEEYAIARAEFSRLTQEINTLERKQVEKTKSDNLSHAFVVEAMKEFLNDKDARVTQQQEDEAQKKIKEEAFKKLEEFWRIISGESVQEKNNDVQEEVEPIVEEPAEPIVEEPVEPTVEEPAEPIAEEPVEPTVEEPAEPIVEEPTEPIVEEPAEPIVEEPAEPIVEEPVEPTVEEPAEPIAEEPVEPTVEEPAEPTPVESSDDKEQIRKNIDDLMKELEEAEREYKIRTLNLEIKILENQKLLSDDISIKEEIDEKINSKREELESIEYGNSDVSKNDEEILEEVPYEKDTNEVIDMDELDSQHDDSINDVLNRAQESSSSDEVSELESEVAEVYVEEFPPAILDYLKEKAKKLYKFNLDEKKLEVPEEFAIKKLTGKKNFREKFKLLCARNKYRFQNRNKKGTLKFFNKDANEHLNKIIIKKDIKNVQDGMEPQFGYTKYLIKNNLENVESIQELYLNASDEERIKILENLQKRCIEMAKVEGKTGLDEKLQADFQNYLYELKFPSNNRGVESDSLEDDERY